MDGAKQSTPKIPTNRCLDGSDKECIALMRTSEHLGLSIIPPSSPGTRNTVIQQAFAMGGAGALQRLITEGTSPSERLAAAAKVPIDTLLAHWVSNVRTRGVVSETLTPGMAIIAIIWIVVIGMLSLANSRWR